MKKKIIILLTLLIFSLTGCEETHENGVPAYFLEPDGYIIARIRTDNDNLLHSGAYGYIMEEDYQEYLNGKINGILIVKHPYEKGKEISVKYNSITSIVIGEYKDMRDY